MSHSSFIHPAPLAPLAAGLRTGQLDLLDTLDVWWGRMAAVEPHLQAFISEDQRQPRLHVAAAALLAAYPDANTRPPLFGVPIGVKDIFHAAGFPTQAGSRLPAQRLAGPEAASVSRLKEAGALVMGKTVTTEFAYFEPGPTRNPHNLAHTPGGSSSGSAAAVAAGLVPLALGTQTIGSVIRPAAFCGIVGFKPSYNRIDPEGLLFFSPSADHVGLFTQDVAGMRLAAGQLCRGWQEISPPDRPVLGIPADDYLQQASAEALALFEQQVAALQAAGYALERVPLFPDIAAINTRHRRLIAAEFAAEHAAWFAEFAHLYRPRTAALIQEGQRVPEEEVEESREGQSLLRQEIEHVMDVHGIDLWICPAVTGPAPLGLDATGDPIMNLPWTHVGLPALTLPAGRAANGLPVGLQLVGRWWEDENLLAWASQLPILAEPEAKRA